MLINNKFGNNNKSTEEKKVNTLGGEVINDNSKQKEKKVKKIVILKGKTRKEGTLNNKTGSFPSKYKTRVKNNAPEKEKKEKKEKKNGKRIKIDCDKDRVLITSNKEVLAIYSKDGNEYLCVRGLW